MSDNIFVNEVVKWRMCPNCFEFYAYEYYDHGCIKNGVLYVAAKDKPT